MEIENLVDEFEDLLESSWNVPLSGGRIVINSKEVKRILEDIRLKLPREMVQAKKIVEDRSHIIEDAKSQAEAMIKVSEEKIRSMLAKEEIVKRAQVAAGQILADAAAQAKEIKNSANEYVEEIMKQLEQMVASNLSEIRKARQMLRSPDFKSE